MKKLNSIENLIGSGIYTGFIPFASGTFASLLAVFIYFIPGFENLYIIIPVTVISFLIGIPIGTKFETQFGKDPAQCTIDEFTGTWISLMFIPKDVTFIAISFFVWRMLDIFKPYPANKMENLSGGLGIMMDDVVAGLYTCLFVNVLYRVII